MLQDLTLQGPAARGPCWPGSSPGPIRVLSVSQFNTRGSASLTRSRPATRWPTSRTRPTTSSSSRPRPTSGRRPGRPGAARRDAVSALGGQLPAEEEPPEAHPRGGPAARGRTGRAGPRPDRRRRRGRGPARSARRSRDRPPGRRQAPRLSPGPALRAAYAEAAALCFPSTCESFGIPAVEAMAQGLPGCAGRLDGAPRDRRRGRLVLPARLARTPSRAPSATSSTATTSGPRKVEAGCGSPPAIAGRPRPIGSSRPSAAERRVLNPRRQPRDRPAGRRTRAARRCPRPVALDDALDPGVAVADEDRHTPSARDRRSSIPLARRRDIRGAVSRSPRSRASVPPRRPRRRTRRVAGRGPSGGVLSETAMSGLRPEIMPGITRRNSPAPPFVTPPRGRPVIGRGRL